MRVDLTGGKWAELRDITQLNAGDRLAVRAQTGVPTGTAEFVPGDWKEKMRHALMARLITSWNYDGWPIPSLYEDPLAAIGQIPLEDYDILVVKVEPYFEKVDYYPSLSTSSE